MDKYAPRTLRTEHAAHRDGRTQPAAPAHDDGKAEVVEVGGGGGGRDAVWIWAGIRICKRLS